MKMEDAAKVIRKPNRVEELDIIKGIAIVLMLIGHCDAGMERPKSVAFIYLFHMAVFFMASGYVFQGEKLKTAKDFYNYCRKKVTGLYVPYVIWAVIFTLLHNVFIRINVYTNDVRLMELVSSRFNAMTPYWSWKEQLYNCKLALLAKANTRMGGGLWFLTTLLFVTCLYGFAEYVLRRLQQSQQIILWQTGIALILLEIGYSFSCDGRHPALGKAFSFYILFHLGRMFKEKRWYEIKWSNRKRLLGLLISFMGLLMLSRLGRIELSANQYKNPFFLLVCSILGWVLLSEAAFYIKKVQNIKRIFLILGQNTLVILILHLLAFKLVNLLGVVLYHQPLCLVAGFPVLYTNGFWWIIYVIVGSAVPILLKMLWKSIGNKIRLSAEK